MEKEVKVEGLILDPVNKMPIVILKEKEGNRLLPIWIGFAEANGIAIALENVKIHRPQTYDLFKNILEQLDINITKIVVTDLKENTYYAKIYLKQGKGKEISVDSRPSDAIALSLRFKTDIYVDEKLLKEVDGLSLEKTDELKKWLEKLSPEQLGKYKM